MSNIPIGIQLYMVREDCQKDLPGTFAKLKQMGYEGVEFAGYYDHTAEQLKKALDDAGLVCCGSHVRIPTLLGDELEKTIAFNKVLENDYLIVPWLDEKYRDSHEAWLETAALFNEIWEKVEPSGLRLGYHNHTMEFEQEMGGELPWETFFNNTAEPIIMQVDVGNGLNGGVDPTPYVEKYPGRSVTVHLKDWWSDGTKGPVGEGEVDWDKFFGLCESVGGTKWYIIEQGCDECTPLECAEKSLQNLREMGK